MSKKFWAVSIISTAIGFTLGLAYEGTKAGDIGWMIGGIGGLCIGIGSLINYLGLKVKFDTLKREPVLILLKVIKSLIVIGVAIGVVVVAVYQYGLNERTGSMIGAAIVLGGLGAIWKPQKTTRCGDDSAKQNKQEQ